MRRSPNRKRICPTCRRRRALVLTRGAWPNFPSRDETYVSVCRGCLPRLRREVTALRREPCLRDWTVAQSFATRRRAGFGMGKAA